MDLTGVAALGRVHGIEPVSEFDLPLLPETPKKVVLNDLASVLCEVENVKW